MGIRSEIAPGAVPEAARPATAAFLRHSVLYAAARLGLTGLDVVLLPFYARALSVTDFGRVGVATSVLALLTIGYTLGFDGALQSLFFREPAGSRQQRAVVGGCVAGTTASGLVWVITLTLLGPGPFGGLLQGVGGDFFRMVVWAAFFNTFVNARLQLLQLQQRSRSYLWFTLSVAGLRIVATLLAIAVFRRGAIGWAEAYLISGVVAALVALAALWRETAFVTPGAILREALPFAVPLFVHQLASWMSQSAGRLVLNQLTTLEAVSIYQVALSIGQGLGLITMAVNFAYAPAFMAAAAESPAEAGKRFGGFASHYLVALSCVAVLGIVSRDYIVTALGSRRFLESAGLVPFVLATAVLQGCYYVVVNPMFFRKTAVRYLPAITVTGALLSLAATYVLVPRIGVSGAALASLIAIGCVVLLAFPLSQRSVFMEYDLARLGKAALLGSVTVAASIAGSWAGLPRLALCAFLWFFFLAAALWLDVVRLSVYREMLQAAVPRGQGTNAE